MTATRRTVLAGLGAALVPACRRAGWTPPEADPSGLAQNKPYVTGAEAFRTHEEQWIASACAQCPAACGIRVRLVEGRAVRIEGHRDNPINRGGIGVRGLSGLQTLYDPDRIPQPLRRVGDRLVPIAWSEAIAMLATALAATRSRAPEQLLVMSGLERGFTHELLARFCRVFGSPNFVDGSPSHGAALAQAMERTLGVRELPAYAWSGAGAILSLEAGLFEDACRSVYFAHAAAALRREGAQRARMFHAGPAFDLAAYNADRWLRIRPGTAGALALGICHVLLRDDTYARELVDGARDVAAFRELCRGYAPERAATITGCEAAQIERLARDLWARRPVLAVVDERSLAFTNGVDTATIAIALSALLGSLENPYGGLRLAPSPPLAAWSEPTLDDLATRALATPRLDGAGAAPFAAATSVLDSLPDAITATPPAVALLFYANPVYARARSARWRDALAKVPLVVSFSPFLDETVADVADLVLPDHTYLERFEDGTPSPGAPRAVAGVRRAVVAPVHDTRATSEVILDLARRLGFAHAFPWPSTREAFEERWLGLHTAARGTIVQPTARAFLDRFYADGFWAETDDAPQQRVALALPATWSEPRWDGDAAQFPLVLVPYHPLGHADGTGANQPWLRNLTPRPGLGPWRFAASIAPEDLPHGVKSGDRIRVVSPYGSLVIAVHVDRRIARGSIAIPTGGGHRAYGRYARGFGVNVMELLAATPVDGSGAAVTCTTRVRVEVIT